MKEEPLFLVSVQSKLAHQINERFYGGLHYVWCSPGFNCPDNPILANPKILFSLWREDFLNHNTESAFIKKNREGLQKGILHQRELGMISEKTVEHLINLTETASIRYFCPVLYVMPYQQVKHFIEDVDFKDRAGPFSIEFRIHDLPNTYFNVFEF